MIKMFFDGSCNPNPKGVIGTGFIVKDGDNIIGYNATRVKANPNNSCNVAEYMALIDGMKFMLNNGHKDSEILVLGDSKMVIDQMIERVGNRSGRGKQNSKALYFPFYLLALEELAKFSNIKFKWIPREENCEADKLSTQETDFQQVIIITEEEHVQLLEFKEKYNRINL
jgi:ribonuclease HI